MLQFDDATRKLLDAAYIGADFTRRRRVSYDAVQPGPGDVILDLGCGNGLLTAELARGVGAEGAVIGIDPSEDMLASARIATEDYPQVRLVNGLADALPLDDASVDKAVSVQVFEYIPDLVAAARDLARVVRSGGMVAIGDMHFDTWAWFSEDAERMKRMMKAWDNHLVHRDIPAILPPILEQAGFEITSVRPLAMTDTVLRPDGMAQMMIVLMENYAVTHGHIPAKEARAWAEEQAALARQGRFFQALTHFVIVARRRGTVS